MPRTGLRALSTAVASLWLCAPVAAALHGAFSSHEHHYCDEHQVFEQGPAPEGSALRADAQEKAPALAAGARQHLAAHVPCALANLAHLAKTLRVQPCAAVAVAGPGFSELRLLALSSPGACSTHPLRVAPKTSPPAS